MFNKTVDSITKVFTQAIADLEAVEKNQTRSIDLQEIAIKEANDKIDLATLERSRAKAVRAKLQAIISN